MVIYDQLKWFGKKPTVKTARDGGKQVTIGTNTTEILAADDERTSFALIVRGSVNVFIELGTTAATTSPEFVPGDSVNCDDYVGQVSGIVAAGSGRVDVFEV